MYLVCGVPDYQVDLINNPLGSQRLHRPPAGVHGFSFNFSVTRYLRITYLGSLHIFITGNRFHPFLYPCSISIPLPDKLPLPSPFWSE